LTTATTEHHSFKNVTVIGDAQMTVMRGKKKCICDFTVEVDWEFVSEGTLYEGHVTILDVTADMEYEFQLGPIKPQPPSSPTKHSESLKTYVTSILNGFMSELLAK
jgi:hypothetical protein